MRLTLAKPTLAALILLSITWGVTNPVQAALSPEMGVFMLPMNCSELLPDATPFLNFFEAIARANVLKDQKFTKRLLRVLALRDHFAESGDRSREQNPIDVLIRRTLCFYREQKEPSRPIGFDDAGLETFMRSSLGELEDKVKQAILQSEIERQQRLEYERKLKHNQHMVDRLEQEADEEADRTFTQLAKIARKKIRQ